MIGIISALILVPFLLNAPPPSETTEPPAPQAEPLRATPRPPIQSPGSGDIVLPTITLAPLMTNPLEGIPALSEHYEECNGKYEHSDQTERKQDFANKMKSSITLQQLQQFVADECPLPATSNPNQPFNPNVPSNPQNPIPITPLDRIQPLNTHTAPPPLTTAPPAGTPTPTKTPVPTATHIPTLTPNPYQLSSAFKPSDIQSLSRQGHFVSAQDYKAIGCYHDPKPSQHIREWRLFTTPDQAVNENSFAVYYGHRIEPIRLQHGTCYILTLQHLGPTEWRACRTEPYGANCTTDSPDFLWERDIPGFRGTADATLHLWRPPEK